MKKLFLSTAFLLSAPSLTFASFMSQEEILQNLTSALEVGDQSGIQFWNSLFDSLPSYSLPSSNSAPRLLREEEERRTHEFLKKEQEQEEERLTREFLKQENHREEERLTREFLVREELLKRDDELARSLSQDEVRILISVEDARFLSDLAKSSLLYDDKDVHVFNKTIVAPNLVKLMEVGQRYLPSREDIPPVTVFDQMRRILREEGDSSNTEKAIQVLEAHLAKTSFDGETGIHVPTLLSRVWDLANNNPNFRFATGIGHEVRNSVQMIVHISMPEGLNTEGGCFPGYAGRFFRDYLTLLNAVLEIR